MQGVRGKEQLMAKKKDAKKESSKKVVKVTAEELAAQKQQTLNQLLQQKAELDAIVAKKSEEEETANREWLESMQAQAAERGLTIKVKGRGTGVGGGDGSLKTWRGKGPKFLQSLYSVGLAQTQARVGPNMGDYQVRVPDLQKPFELEATRIGHGSHKFTLGDTGWENAMQKALSISKADYLDAAGKTKTPGPWICSNNLNGKAVVAHLFYIGKVKTIKDVPVGLQASGMSAFHDMGVDPNTGNALKAKESKEGDSR